MRGAHGAMLRDHGPRVRTEAGFTLLEVLVALTILAVAVVSLIQLSSQSLHLVKASSDYQEAVLVADRLAADTQINGETLDSGQEGLFRWERRVAIVPLPDELKSKQTVPGQEDPKLFSVTIDVYWGANKVLELATLRTPTTAPVPTSQGTPAGGTQPGTQTPTPTRNPGSGGTPVTQPGGMPPGGLGR